MSCSVKVTPRRLIAAAACRVLDSAGDELAGDLCATAGPGALVSCCQGGDAAGHDLTAGVQDRREGGGSEAVRWRLDARRASRSGTTASTAPRACSARWKGWAGGRCPRRRSRHWRGGWWLRSVSGRRRSAGRRCAHRRGQPGQDGDRRLSVRPARAGGHDGVEKFRESLTPVLVIAGVRQAGELNRDRIGAGAAGEVAPWDRVWAIQMRAAAACSRRGEW